MSVSRVSDINLGYDRMNQLILILGCYFGAVEYTKFNVQVEC